MIEKRCQDVRKHLKGAHNENPHDNPFSNLLRQGAFYDLPEAKAERGSNRSHHDCSPNRRAFAERPFVYHTQSIRAETISFSCSDLHPFKISSSPIGSYAPSFTSSNTVPDSRDSRLCHWPAGMLMMVPPGTMSMVSASRPSSS